ncbi:hypothetical protein CPC08DRAFT_706269 [Agrocybe pediades]|nr:hypothetical protein CPC08DRAFT_706269 [Agrocybe pediades]
MATVAFGFNTGTDAINIIDSKIEQYEKEILALKTQRNAHATISRLPPELLTRIFEWCKHSEPVSTRYYFRRRPLAWIGCTHVCRLWRSIALNSPTLWSDIDFDHFTWAKEMLIRSKMADLKVSIHLQGTPEDVKKAESARFILCQGSRLVKLNIHTWDKDCDNYVQGMLRSLPRSTPKLRSLEISLTSSYPRVIFLPSESICEAEKLERLTLLRCGIDWVQHLSNKSFLTVLTLVNVQNISAISAAKFLQCLAGMPSIRKLELIAAFPAIEQPDTGVHSLQRIPLLHLQELKLKECSASALDFFFKHVALGAGVSINITSHGNDESSFMGVLGEISSTLSLNKTTSTLRSLEIVSATSKNLAMTGYSHDLQEVGGKAIAPAELEGPILTLDLTISSVSSGLVQGMLWTNACSSLPLASIKGISWAREPAISVQAMISCFGNLPNLESLEYCCGYPQLDTMLQASLPSPDTTSQELKFPKLRKLTLENFTFGGGCVNNLIDVFIQRYECGAELENLVIVDCYEVDDIDVVLLNEVVADVTWDGIVHGDTSDLEEDSESDYHYYYNF